MTRLDLLSVVLTHSHPETTLGPRDYILEWFSPPTSPLERVPDVEVGTLPWAATKAATLFPSLRRRRCKRAVGADAQVHFAEAAALTPQDLAAVQQQVRGRVLRWFARAGHLEPADARDVAGWHRGGGL